jgi:hypothetical protein
MPVTKIQQSGAVRMLQDYTIVPVSHEQALNVLAEIIDTMGNLDMGYTVAHIASHPVHGDLFVIENVCGMCAVCIARAQARKFTD